MTSVLFFGICDYLGKINEIDLAGRRNTDSAVLTPRISETITLSRPCAPDNFSSYAFSIALSKLSATASSFENTWHADSERLTAEGKLELFPNH